MSLKKRIGVSAPIQEIPTHLQIEYVSPGLIRAAARNARQHSLKQIKQIASSIEVFGFNVPVLMDNRNVIIAGHGRLEAAKSLGLKQIPAIRLEHLTENQRRAFMIADNRLSLNSTWNDQMLGEELKFLADAELEFSVEVTGFEMGEIDLVIQGLDDKAEPDEADTLPAIETSPVTTPGDLWLLGKHRVVCGNALEPSQYPRLMDGKRADVLFADPPYNVKIDKYATGFGKIHHREFLMAGGELSDDEFTAFLKGALKNCSEQSKSGSMHFVFMDWRHMSNLLAAGTSVYSELKGLCVWDKGRGGQGSLYRSQHELIFVFKHGKTPHRNNIQLGSMGRYRTNIWAYPSATTFSRTSDEGNLFALHPTVKPVALVADAILDCSARGGIVLDPFLGSATTVIAAERTGRICYGLELDPLYIDTAIRRWQAFTGKSAIHEKTGISFREREEAAHAA